jgi:uracil-DNA glycosylase family 4
MPEAVLIDLLNVVRACTFCSDELHHSPRPVVQAGDKANLLIIGQAPGKKVNETGIPWNDKSGEKLREWLGVGAETFYDSGKIAILPIGFCYPGKGKSGDLPPSRICAPTWHNRILRHIPGIKLTLLVGNYAQDYYLKDNLTLTERIRNCKSYFPFIPLPHPSPRNFMWFRRNTWFEEEVLPYLKEQIKLLL